MGKMISVAAWARKQMKDPAVKAEYDRLEPEFAAYRAKILRAEKTKKQSTSTSAKPRKPGLRGARAKAR